MRHLSADVRFLRQLLGSKAASFCNPLFAGGPRHPAAAAVGPRTLDGPPSVLPVTLSARRFTTNSDDIKLQTNILREHTKFISSYFGIDVERKDYGKFSKNWRNYKWDFGQSHGSKSILGGSQGVRSASSHPIGKCGVRMYSTNNGESGNEPKGVVFHMPHPIDWLKHLWYMFLFRGYLDSSFSREEFMVGAKQAFSYLMRLAVLKDFESMNSVASTEVVGKMKEIVSTLSLEQLRSLEILPENINLARCNISAVRYGEEGSFAVSIDVFCLAIRVFRSQPLLVQMIIRFCRNYENDKQGDWQMDSIREFNIKEIGESKDEDRRN